MSAQTTLDRIYSDMTNYHPAERAEVEDLVAKLEKVCEHYKGSAQLAIAIVGLKICAEKGQ